MLIRKAYNTKTIIETVQRFKFYLKVGKIGNLSLFYKRIKFWKMFTCEVFSKNMSVSVFEIRF